jgi:hypothetical protein
MKLGLRICTSSLDWDSITMEIPSESGLCIVALAIPVVINGTQGAGSLLVFTIEGRKSAFLLHPPRSADWDL